jgi:hypothetical protein
MLGTKFLTRGAKHSTRVDMAAAGVIFAAISTFFKI